jgi:environmental stress-induced protein Ves
MEISIYNSNYFKTSQWSGGSTTEFFIYPEGSSYSERNFSIRLSSATVETEISEFTYLPGYFRHLMILDGRIELEHEGHYTKKLIKTSTDEFDGAWKSVSKGTCIDFNLMLSPGYRGKLFFADGVQGFGTLVEMEKFPYFWFIYIYKGEVEFEFENEVKIGRNKELLAIKEPSHNKFKFSGLTKFQIVVVSVHQEQNSTPLKI